MISLDERIVTVSGVLLVILLAAWYLSYQAARLDRLHAKVEGAMSVLDAQLVRRAEAALEVAHSGALDPASALLVAEAAGEALERHTVHAGEDLLDGHQFGGREQVESDLTEALGAALPDDVIAEVRGRGDDLPAAALDRLGAAGERAEMALRFYNDAVREVRRVRAKGVVRLFRLAGHAALPEPVALAAALPSSWEP